MKVLISKPNFAAAAAKKFQNKFCICAKRAIVNVQ
jgi:hypothetical protein